MPADPYFDTVYDLFAKAECWGIYDDVLPAFDAVEERGLRSGILSNFDERLRPLLADLSLSQRIELIVTSAEAGVEKPHPGIFEVAGRLAGSEPRSLALIGDSLEADSFGARRAGWSSCVVDREGRRHGRHVASFPDLVSCVEHLSQ
jgi:putative hydrolase of the HAD superfamily